MNVRIEYAPGVTTVRDDDTGEILIFALIGNGPFSKFYELLIGQKITEPAPRSDYR